MIDEEADRRIEEYFATIPIKTRIIKNTFTDKEKDRLFQEYLQKIDIDKVIDLTNTYNNLKEAFIAGINSVI